MSAKLHHERGTKFLQQGDMEHAAQEYQQCISLEPNNPEGYYHLALVMFNVMQLEAALELYSHAISLAPHYMMAFSNRGNLYRIIGQFDAAAADFEAALQLDPRDAITLLNLAWVQFDQGKVQAAKDTMMMAVRLAAPQQRPQFQKQLDGLNHDASTLFEPDTLNLAAIEALQRGQMYEAFTSINRAIRFATDTQQRAMYHHNRAMMFAQLEQRRFALADFNAAIAGGYQLPEVYNARAATLLELQQFAEALKDADQAIAMKPTYHKFFFHRGAAYSGMHQYRQAIEAYTEALKIEPNYIPARFNRADAYDQLGQKANAIADFQFVLKNVTDPQQKQAIQQRIKSLQ